MTYSTSFLVSAVTALLVTAGGPSLVAAESLPVCSKCLNPRVISKSGTGTAAAVAEAKVVAEDAAAWCSVQRPRDPYCVREEVKQGGDGNRAAYRASASCSTGQLQSMNGGDFTYAGVWADGPGQGHPMFRGPQGNIPQWESIRSGTGKARGEWDLFGGYSLAGQWEVLCGKTAPPAAGTVARPKAEPKMAEKEWLSLCGKCENPAVFAKSGIGTANAVAQARSPETGNKVYRASANCMAGQIHTIQEKSYTLAGVWDNSDIGGGRTKWRGTDGQIVLRDSASDGLAISEQWEVLCPGPVPAQLLAQANGNSTGPARVPEHTKPLAGVAALTPPAVSACTGKRYCDEAASFAAIITDLRPGIYNSSTRVVSATVKFLNKTNRPLTLGYVRNAGIAIDEQGNRYVLASPENVRGIAEIVNGGEFDPKFTVPPGSTADARFEFSWRWNGRDVIGTRAWDIDLTVREVGEVSPRQYRFGQERALQFKAVPGRNALEAAPAGPLSNTTEAPGGPPASIEAPRPAPVTQFAGATPEPDACAGKPRCYDAGPFVAEIAQVTVLREGVTFQSRLARLNIRFRNKTAQPITLGYVAGTSVLVDNFGKRFTWGSGHDTSVTGMGVVEASKANPQFVLGPGESRAATFALYRSHVPKTELDATGYTYDVSIAQMEVLYNGQQIRTVREHTMTFPDFGAPTPTGVSATGIPAGAKPAAQSIREAGDALRGILKKK
jgi:hypothetical protein